MKEKKTKEKKGEGEEGQKRRKAKEKKGEREEDEDEDKVVCIMCMAYHAFLAIFYQILTYKMSATSCDMLYQYSKYCVVSCGLHVCRK